MEIIKVEDRMTARLFRDVAREIYRDDPNWVCPLDDILEGIFDPDRNEYFVNGDAMRWVLRDAGGKLVGRVAAFFNRDKALKYDPPVGGMGFFECIHDREAAFLLFDTARDWLQDNGMGGMDGPVNFGENDNFWGLLVDGFTPPAFGMNYNPPYYRELFEAYGFKPFFEQESRHLNLRKPFPERFWKIAEWVMRKPGYTFEHIRMDNLDKYVRDVVEIHNTAWVYHEHFTPLTVEKVKKSLRLARHIIIEEFIWFVYHEGAPIAFFVMIPDMNQVFRLFNGRMNAWNKLRFLLLRRGKRVDRSRVTIMGVVPRFQGQGIESAIFWHLRKPVLEDRPHYRELEISWVGDFNPKMKATLEALGADPGKIHITFRKLFDHSTAFRKATSIPEVKSSK